MAGKAARAAALVVMFAGLSWVLSSGLYGLLLYQEAGDIRVLEAKLDALKELVDEHRGSYGHEDIRQHVETMNLSLVSIHGQVESIAKFVWGIGTGIILLLVEALWRHIFRYRG